MAKVQAIKDLDHNELQTRLKESQEALFRIKFQMGMGQTDGIKKYRELKRDRARILTQLRTRELAAAADKNRSK